MVAGKILALMTSGRGLLAGSALAGTLAALLALSPYLAAALAFAELTAPNPDSDRLLLIGLAAVAGVAARHAFFGLSTALSHLIAFRVQKELRLRLAAKLSWVPLGWFDDTAKGRVRSILLDDVEATEDGIAHLIPETSAALLAPALVLVALVVVDWRLTVLTLVPMVVGMWLLGRLLKSGEGPTRDYIEIQAKLAETTAEIADGLPTVRMFDQAEQATQRAFGMFALMTRFSNDWMRGAVVPGGLAQILLSSHLLVVAPAGLLMAAAGQISVTTLAVFLALALGLGDIFGAIQGISHRVMRQFQHLDNIETIFALPEMPEAETKGTIGPAAIDLDQVGFAYGARAVIDGISVRVEPGRSLALVGPSGSGKSTLVRLVARFLDVRSGAVRIGGVDVRDMSAEDLHARLAVVFQDVFLFAGTIADNIRLGRADASDADIAAAAKAARAHDFICALPNGYDTLVGERGHGLSGGERQRISIARAVLKNAPVLILDEATAFADPENEAEIQTAIAELARERTMIVIAHRLHTITHVDEILVLDQGRVAERGRHDDLVAAGGLYARMWAAQQAVRSYRHVSRGA
ncbi:Iron import ATP-binding/permease protein IrtA [Blastochloris viridis]|uniref:ABC transporter ATP-binding protein n=2 Tax=Blastochloris viridis TaxID=1079 RepID=A0A0H5BH99_BLAVI|nr:Iron import ATP-binding/permease protein IrtA [Blastochloris viridis]BAS00500.1 ABC transporter ATP-binding protein [Blastochloris viridis]CUU42273.1 Iron import ATP-binding/permease protein IrtA [Blastochloris viridis]